MSVAEKQQKPQTQLTVSEAEERSGDKIDVPMVRSMSMQPLAGGGAFLPQSVGEVLEFAKLMAGGRIAVRAHFRGSAGACLAVCMQAARWGMDPYAVANKSFVVNDQLAYESQLITAVINTRAPIQGRLKTRFTGEGATRKCIAYATFIGDSEPTEVESPPIGTIKPKNSPLWTSDPDQQLAYYTKRLWARRECPEILLGVYDVEEVQSMVEANPGERAPSRPQRQDFEHRTETVVDAEEVRDEDDDADTASSSAAPRSPRGGSSAEEGSTAGAGAAQQASAGESDASESNGGKSDGGADGGEEETALSPDWQEYLTQRLQAIDRCTSSTELGEMQEGQRMAREAQAKSGNPIPAEVNQALATAFAERGRALLGGGGRGRR